MDQRRRTAVLTGRRPARVRVHAGERDGHGTSAHGPSPRHQPSISVAAQRNSGGVESLKLCRLFRNAVESVGCAFFRQRARAPFGRPGEPAGRQISGGSELAASRRLSWNGLNRRICACDRCPRLLAHCQSIAEKKRRAYQDDEYWGGPVPNFGDPQAQVLIVGLAPGAHGANRTGRLFTGDRSGDWLYRALHRAGFANQAAARTRDDGLQLTDCAITAACHCAPPDNRPSRDELENCREWFDATIDLLPVRVFVALGQIGWRAVVDVARDRGWYDGSLPKFGHGAELVLSEGRFLVGSFHPSQQNTFTGRLTEPMLDAVFTRARELLAGA